MNELQNVRAMTPTRILRTGIQSLRLDMYLIPWVVTSLAMLALDDLVIKMPQIGASIGQFPFSLAFAIYVGNLTVLNSEYQSELVDSSKFRARFVSYLVFAFLTVLTLVSIRKITYANFVFGETLIRNVLLGMLITLVLSHFNLSSVSLLVSACLIAAMFLLPRKATVGVIQLNNLLDESSANYLAFGLFGIVFALKIFHVPD